MGRKSFGNRLPFLQSAMFTATALPSAVAVFVTRQFCCKPGAKTRPRKWFACRKYFVRTFD